jgi:hypothetical protein
LYFYSEQRNLPSVTKFLTVSTIITSFITMKKAIVVIIFFLGIGFTSTQAQSQDWALGLRLGDPSGVNFRKYFGSSNALDINVGSSGYYYNRGRRYRDRYYEYGGITLQVNYVWQRDIYSVDGLQWYYGLGGQLGSRRYYDYEFYNRNRYVGGYTRSIALGATGIIGAEYFIPGTPISVYADAALYMEVIPLPFWLSVPIGIGGRFNF